VAQYDAARPGADRIRAALGAPVLFVVGGVDAMVGWSPGAGWRLTVREGAAAYRAAVAALDAAP